jgi:hypothetical protein
MICSLFAVGFNLTSSKPFPIYSLHIIKMTCSSRISRIVPTSLPLTIEIIPRDFQNRLSPPLSHNEAIVMPNKCQGGTMSPIALRNKRTPTSSMLDMASTFPPNPTFKMLSWERQRSYLPHHVSKHDRTWNATNSERLGDQCNAAGRDSMRNPVSRQACPVLKVESSSQGDKARSSPSPTFISAPDRTRWMMVATRVHKRNNEQYEDEPTVKEDKTETHDHRYSHVVRTDALAPSAAHIKDSVSLQATAHQKPPWLTDNHEIDWATYYKNQPIPSSATWSRLEATVQSVEETWTGTTRIMSP